MRKRLAVLIATAALLGSATVAGAASYTGQGNGYWTQDWVGTYDGYNEYELYHYSASGNLTCDFYYADVNGDAAYEAGIDILVSGKSCAGTYK